MTCLLALHVVVVGGNRNGIEYCCVDFLSIRNWIWQVSRTSVDPAVRRVRDRLSLPFLDNFGVRFSRG